MALSDAVEASKRAIRERFESGQAEFSESDLRDILGSESKLLPSVLSCLKGEGLIEEIVKGLDETSRGAAAAGMIFGKKKPPGFDGGIYEIRREILDVPAGDKAAEWTVPMRVSNLKVIFKIRTKQRWTEFGNKLREKGTLRDIAGSGFREVSIHRSVFVCHGIKFPE